MQASLQPALGAICLCVNRFAVIAVAQLIRLIYKAGINLGIRTSYLPLPIPHTHCITNLTVIYIFESIFWFVLPSIVYVFI